MIKNSSAFEKEQLLYLMSGTHGSPWFVLLQLLTAHCHTSLQSRLTAARTIFDNYEIEEKTQKSVNPEAIKPNLKLLEVALEQCKKAAQNKQAGYSIAFCLDEIQPEIDADSEQ